LSYLAYSVLVWTSLRPGHDCEEVELEVAFHALGPYLEAGKLRKVLRLRADLPVRRAAAVVLLARGVFGVTVPRVLGPVEREARPGNAHLGEVRRRGRHEVGFERGHTMRLVPRHVLGAEGHLEARVPHRGRLHADHQRAVDERRNVGVNGLLPWAQRGRDLAEAGRLEEGHDGACTCEVPHASAHVERRVRLAAHYRVVHVLPCLGHRLLAVEGHQNIFSGESRSDHGAKEEYGSQHLFCERKKSKKVSKNPSLAKYENI